MVSGCYDLQQEGSCAHLNSFHHGKTAHSRACEPLLLCPGPGNLFGLFLLHVSEVMLLPQEGTHCEVFAVLSPQHPENSPDSQRAMLSLKGLVLIRLSV